MGGGGGQAVSLLGPAILGALGGVVSGGGRGQGQDLRNLLSGLNIQRPEPEIKIEAPKPLTARRVHLGARPAAPVVESPLPPELPSPQPLPKKRPKAAPLPSIVERYTSTQREDLLEDLPLEEQFARLFEGPITPSTVFNPAPSTAENQRSQELSEPGRVRQDEATAAVPQLNGFGIPVESPQSVEPARRPRKVQQTPEVTGPIEIPEDSILESSPHLADPRTTSMLTINGAPVDIGPLTEQVLPDPSPDTVGDLPEPVKSKQKVISNVDLRVDDDGITLLEEFEGRESFAYEDVAGYLTIGIGHKLTKEELKSGKIQINGEEVDWRKGLNERQMDRLAAQDMAVAAQTVRDAVKVPLEQGQFNALVSFAYNIGSQAFKNAGAIKALNAGDMEEFSRRHSLWINSGGKPIEGLKKRRAMERMLFTQGKVVR